MHGNSNVKYLNRFKDMSFEFSLLYSET